MTQKNEVVCVFRGGPYDGTEWTLTGLLEEVKFPDAGGWIVYRLSDAREGDKYVMEYLRNGTQ